MGEKERERERERESHEKFTSLASSPLPLEKGQRLRKTFPGTTRARLPGCSRSI